MQTTMLVSGGTAEARTIQALRNHLKHDRGWPRRAKSSRNPARRAMRAHSRGPAGQPMLVSSDRSQELARSAAGR
jgi:hypothetical protein